MTQPTPMALAPVTLALFGVGRWGTHLLRNFLAHPQVSVQAVVDPSAAQLRQTAETFHLSDEVRLLTDWQAAMALPGLTGVAIATPAATHFELVGAALKRDLAVLVEKPLTLDSQTSAQLCQLAQQRLLMVDHTYLFHPVVQAGKAALGKVGQPRYGYATRTHLGPVRFDVDALWDLAIHDIAIFNHWLGEQPQQVQAHGLIWQQSTPIAPQFPQGLADVVWCRLRYPSGFEAVIHLCWANPDKQRRLCIVGDRGTLIFDEMCVEQPLTLQAGQLDRTDGKFVPTDQASIPIDTPPAEPLRQMCDHFVDCVLTNQPSQLSSGQVGMALVRVLEGLSQSLYQDGQWVNIG
ncbi:MAG: Gfo/Idh/MocA family oxidoreductase [Cyanobacteria bacterium J06554_6]